MKVRQNSVCALLVLLAAILAPALLPTLVSAQTGPSITQQPASQMVGVGANVTLTVAVSGSGPFTYQWIFNGTNLPSGLITTVAGGGPVGNLGDVGPATQAFLNSPYGVAEDASGDLFIVSQVGQSVRKVDAKGIITTVAGNGTRGYSGDGGFATGASLDNPVGAVVDSSGSLFIADSGNYRVRKVDVNGIITTVAGIGASGILGDCGPATNAFVSPISVAVNTFGNLFIAGNGRIREVDTNGIITTVAGTGSSGFSGDGGSATNAEISPSAVALDVFGDLFIAEQSNLRVRKVDLNGVITTVAGNGSSGYSGDGGAATNASLDYPEDVAVDPYGNLFITDVANQRIRKVDSRGIIITVAGDGTTGYSGDGGAATNASLKFPTYLAVDAFGNLFIADTVNQRVREVHFGAPSLNLDSISGSSEKFVLRMV